MAISLFTPIDYLRPCSSAENVLSRLSHYFSLGGCATVIRGNTVQITDDQTMQKNQLSWRIIALKVVSYILLFPITALAFAAYLYLHFSLCSQYSFAIISDPSPTFPAPSTPPAPRESAQGASASVSLAAPVAPAASTPITGAPGVSPSAPSPWELEKRTGEQSACALFDSWNAMENNPLSDDKIWIVEVVYKRLIGEDYTIVGQLVDVMWENISADGLFDSILKPSKIRFLIKAAPECLSCRYYYTDHMLDYDRPLGIRYLKSIRRLPYTVQSVRAKAEERRKEKSKIMRDALKEQMPTVLAAIVKTYVADEGVDFPKKWGRDLPPKWRDFLITFACASAPEEAVE